MARGKVVIMWRNKVSNETGFVAKVVVKEGHFINANSADEVRRYPNEGLATADVNKLFKTSEVDNNEFIIVDEVTVNNHNWA